MARKRDPAKRIFSGPFSARAPSACACRAPNVGETQAAEQTLRCAAAAIAEERAVENIAICKLV